MRRVHDGSDPDLERFLASFLYGREAFLVDELVRVDTDARSITARVAPRHDFPTTRFQRADELHPAHVSGPDLVMMTGCLGCLHAWLFHGCRWDEGWIGFGNRIYRADFRNLASLDAPIALNSRETRARVGARRIVLRYEFRFTQSGREVYHGDQSAMFLRPDVPG